MTYLFVHVDSHDEVERGVASVDDLVVLVLEEGALSQGEITLFWDLDRHFLTNSPSRVMRSFMGMSKKYWPSLVWPCLLTMMMNLIIVW